MTQPSLGLSFSFSEKAYNVLWLLNKNIKKDLNSRLPLWCFPLSTVKSEKVCRKGLLFHMKHSHKCVYLHPCVYRDGGNPVLKTRYLNILKNTYPDHTLGGNPLILIIPPSYNSSLKPPSKTTFWDHPLKPPSECLMIITLLQSQTSCFHQNWCYVFSDLRFLWMTFGYYSKDKDVSLKIFKSTRQLLVHILKRKVPNIWIIQQRWRTALLFTVIAYQAIGTEASRASESGERHTSTVTNKQAHTI